MTNLVYHSFIVFMVLEADNEEQWSGCWTTFTTAAKICI